MPMTVRELRDGDLDWAVGLYVAWDPLPGEVNWRRLLSGEAVPILRHLVVEENRERVGLGAVATPEGLPYPIVSILVVQPHRGRGIGTLLLSELLPYAESEQVGAAMPVGDPESLAIVQSWGFEVVSHGIDSVLGLADRPEGPGLPSGCRLEHVAGPSILARAAEIDAFLAQVGDFPEVELLGTRLTAGILRTYNPDAEWLLLLDEGGIVAATAIEPRADGDWYVDFTGVLPRARGRGLAASIKTAAHAMAERRGARRVRTTNEERNARVRALNARLGYRPDGGDIRLLRAQ